MQLPHVFYQAGPGLEWGDETVGSTDYSYTSMSCHGFDTKFLSPIGHLGMDKMINICLLNIPVK